MVSDIAWQTVSYKYGQMYDSTAKNNSSHFESCISSTVSGQKERSKSQTYKRNGKNISKTDWRVCLQLEEPANVNCTIFTANSDTITERQDNICLAQEVNRQLFFRFTGLDLSRNCLSFLKEKKCGHIINNPKILTFLKWTFTGFWMRWPSKRWPYRWEIASSIPGDATVIRGQESSRT